MSRSVLLLVASLFAAAGAPGADWPNFRGPDSNGAASPGILEPGRVALELDWRRDLGDGYSGISIVGTTGVTLFGDGKDDWVAAFDVSTGQERWRFRLAETYIGHGGSEDGPNGSPTIVGERVYALGRKGQLVALRLADGQALWTRTLDGKIDSREPVWGYATTPVVVGDAVIVQTGGPNGRSLSAFRTVDGELVWSTGDDPVAYQSPLLVELSGRRQLLVVNNVELSGVDPEEGTVLWHHPHGNSDPEGFGQPILIPGNRILVNFFEEAALFEVNASASGYGVQEVWRTRDLRQSYGLPVYHQGYLYGYGSRFLTCVDPATGKSVWKSRPPGGQSLILVDGHLVLTGAEGDLVIAEASSAGYKEVARLALFEEQSQTLPSLSGEFLYLRDHDQLARVRVSRGAATLVTSVPDQPLELPAGAFGDVLRRVQGAASAGEKQAALDRFFEQQSSSPVIENDRVHFVYRGQVEDIAVAGTMLDPGEELPLLRLPGTDLYFATLELDPEAHFEYRFNRNFGELIADPRNPHAIGSLDGPSSELRMPRWPVPDFVSDQPAERRGRVDTFTHRSQILDNERQIGVYLPAGYDNTADDAADDTADDTAGDTEERYSLVLYHNGDRALEMAQIDRALDHLIELRVAPVIVVLLPRVGAEFGGEASDDYLRMLTEELVPHLERTYRVRSEPGSRAVLGVGSGGYISAYAAFKAPGFFGKLATQSLYMDARTKEGFLEMVRKAPRQPLDVYVEISRHDYRFPDIGLDAAADSQVVADLLEEQGYTVRRSQVSGAAGWGSWRSGLGSILATFYPCAP